MIEVIPYRSQIIEAELKGKEMGEINRSIRHGEGNSYGFLGEILVAEKFGCKIENTYDYDIVSKKGTKIDVKTKVTTCIPKPNFECSVVSYQNQHCDLFIFVRILNDKSKGWILGYIKPDDFYKKAVFRKKGQLDPNSLKHRPFTFTADCYNLKISDLSELN